jgi:hypothetical protein
MFLLGPLAITITGQDTAIQGWAGIFFGVPLVLVGILLFILARREGSGDW